PFAYPEIARVSDKRDCLVRDGIYVHRTDGVYAPPIKTPPLPEPQCFLCDFTSNVSRTFSSPGLFELAYPSPSLWLIPSGCLRPGVACPGPSTHKDPGCHAGVPSSLRKFGSRGGAVDVSLAGVWRCCVVAK